MKKDEELRSLSLAKLMEMEMPSDAEGKSIIYGQNCIVVQNMKTGTGSQMLPIFMYPTRVNIVLIVLCLKGSADLQCDLQHCHIEENTLFICKPGTILQVLSGRCTEISAIVMDMSMQEELNISFQKLLPHYSRLEKLTVFPLSIDECVRFNTMIGFLYDSISGNPSQLFYHECVRSQLVSLAYEFLAIFSRNLLSAEEEKTYSTRHQDYFRQFINLLGLHFREQRRISYYASQLNITPKYLGTIVMQTTGRPASAWVNEYVMAEARTLLRNSSLSIQEIAYALNFPNQSFFGKYFKAHAGVSPSAFRK